MNGEESDMYREVMDAQEERELDMRRFMGALVCVSIDRQVDLDTDELRGSSSRIASAGCVQNRIIKTR